MSEKITSISEGVMSGPWKPASCNVTTANVIDFKKEKKVAITIGLMFNGPMLKLQINKCTAFLPLHLNSLTVLKASKWEQQVA